jgi:hypothetical protein
MSDEAMNDETPPEVMPRVRPLFRKLAIAAFVLLIPIALFALWDYIEARRLGAAVKSLRDAKQPLTPPAPSMNFMRPDNAARYYDAASALVDLTDTYGPKGLLQRLDRGEPGSPELLAELRAVLERNREAEALLQRATDLEFHGVRFESNYRWGGLMTLSQLADLRAYERLAAGDAEGSARSVMLNLRLVKPLNWNGRAGAIEPMSNWSITAVSRALRTLPAVVQLQPSDKALDTLRREIAAMDVDDAIERGVILDRSLLIQTFWDDAHKWYARPWRNFVPQPFWQVLRPWLAHRAVALVALYNDFQQAARRPWPQRLEVQPSAAPVVRRGFLGSLRTEYSDAMVRSIHRERTAIVARRLALTRSAIAIIAAEQYRRGNGGAMPDSLESLVPTYLDALPVDPYSGNPLRYHREADRLVIYSIGENRRDDAGASVGEGLSRRWGAYQLKDQPPDIGLSMRVSGGSE